jgi:hypothetical protein
MIKNILGNYGLYIYIGLVLIIALIVILIIFMKKKNKDVEEDKSSILDINIDGVVDKDFNYGYENEDTLVNKKKSLKGKKKTK